MKYASHKSKPIWLFAIATVISSVSYGGDSFETAIRKFGVTSGIKGYAQPLQDLVGADMTSGWFQSAEIPRSGFHFSIGIVGMGALLNDDQKVFRATDPTTGLTFETATAFGDAAGTVKDANGNVIYTAPAAGSIDLSFLPLAALQVRIGHIQGTEAVFRGIPYLPENSGLPKMVFWGAGLRHSISQYFTEGEPPIHVALGAYYNSITVGDFVSATSFYAGPQISKTFSILELYAGVGYTKSTMNVKFPGVDIDYEGTDKVRGTAGVAINVLILRIHADANFGSVTSLSTGVGFNF